MQAFVAAFDRTNQIICRVCDVAVMNLLSDIKSHIEFISSDFFNSFVPMSCKTTENPFFHPIDILPPIPSTEKRKLNIDIPHVLIDVYNKYSSDVDFKKNNFIFMSENEILERNEYKKTKGQHRMVDFAFMHMGMGHIIVISYDPDTMQVYSMTDGGSNGFDRVENAQNRIKANVEGIDKSRIEDLIVHSHKLI